MACRHPGAHQAPVQSRRWILAEIQTVFLLVARLRQQCGLSRRQLEPVSRDSGNAALAALPDGAEWTDYAYFDERWGRRGLPIGFEESQDPNANTIGIEVLSLGYHEHSSSEYTDAMYTSLSGLIADICVRHGIERVLGPVCGHEDVNPIGRWGWDPNQGFDWSRALSGGAMS